MQEAHAIAQQLQAWDAVWHEAGHWVHPSWYRAMGIERRPEGSAAAVHFRVAVGLAIPPLRSFDSPANRLAVLPAEWLCRLLRARGLLRHRPALRHCVEPMLRRRVTEWLHGTVYDTVLRESADDMHRDDRGLPLPPSQSAGPADALAWEGFCLFERDGVWTDHVLVRRMRLLFDQDQQRPDTLDAFPGARDGSAWVLQRLPQFVPEATWLYG